MPDVHPADVFFGLLIGTLALVLAVLTLREAWLRAHGK